MEKQMWAKREKWASIATSEGDRYARINQAEGLKKQAIAVSEGEKQKLINEAEGYVREIELVAQATAQGITEVTNSLKVSGGKTATNFRVAEMYVVEFGKLAKEENTLIIPQNLGNLSSMVATDMSLLGQAKKTGQAKTGINFTHK